MRISRVRIENFRNFHQFDIHLGEQVVMVGENKVGKSNFIAALRLVLDPSLPDSSRHLRAEDFWDGLARPLTKTDHIRIDVDLTDYQNDTSIHALLADALIDPATMTSRLSYVFEPLPLLTGEPKRESDYRFMLFKGDRPERQMDPAIRRRLPLDVLPAMRDAEGALSNWRSSPLRPLLEHAAASIDRDELRRLATALETVSDSIAEDPQIENLASAITNRLASMVGPSHALSTSLGFAPTDPERLIRSLRLFIDGSKRGVGEASLGSANLIYLTLKQLELEKSVREYERAHTFFCIEEPEAHLHPHLQRLVYREYLRPRVHVTGASPAPSSGDGTPDSPAETLSTTSSTEASGNDSPVPGERALTKMVTTHSPHIVSVAPVRSLALIKRLPDNSSIGVSTSQLSLTASDVADLERYLDISRGEVVFARGVLLVEGAAETYLLPALGRKLGVDFDEYGITVCSVAGTDFAPYLKLIGPSGLDLPYAVLTDHDPMDDARALGPDRVKSLYPLTGRPGESLADCPDLSSDEFSPLMMASGLFLNTHTLEVDLFRSGQHVPMATTLKSLTENGACRTRAEKWASDPESMDPERLLKDIQAIGKGRFAQRLVSCLLDEGCPQYIIDAIQHVAAKCR